MAAVQFDRQKQFLQQQPYRAPLCALLYGVCKGQFQESLSALLHQHTHSLSSSYTTQTPPHINHYCPCTTLWQNPASDKMKKLISQFFQWNWTSDRVLSEKVDKIEIKLTASASLWPYFAIFSAFSPGYLIRFVRETVTLPWHESPVGRFSKNSHKLGELHKTFTYQVIIWKFTCGFITCFHSRS